MNGTSKEPGARWTVDGEVSDKFTPNEEQRRALQGPPTGELVGNVGHYEAPRGMGTETSKKPAP